MLQNAGPVRGDGSDKFFGLENVRITPDFSPTGTPLLISDSSLEIPGLSTHWKVFVSSIDFEIVIATP